MTVNFHHYRYSSNSDFYKHCPSFVIIIVAFQHILAESVCQFLMFVLKSSQNQRWNALNETAPKKQSHDIRRAENQSVNI